jgi:hypothetical protein
MALVRGGITVKPHVQAFADACQAATGADSYGTYNGHSPPEGPTQALDIFNAQTENGYRLQDRIAEFAIANQARFGVRYVIKWDPAAGRDVIWNIERAAEGWRAMSTRDHGNHVHITFYASAPEPVPAPAPTTPKQEVPEVAKVAYPLQVTAGRRRLPILAIGGGYGWARAAVTFASAGTEVRRAVVGGHNGERPIAGLAPDGPATSRHYAGRGYVELTAGDEWVEIEIDHGTLDLYVEAADA